MVSVTSWLTAETDSFSELTEVPTDFFGIFRKRLQLYSPKLNLNTRLLYSIQQKQIGEVQAT